MIQRAEMEIQPTEESETCGMLECITPLYGFSSDVEEFTTGRKWSIRMYGPDALSAFKQDDKFAAFFRLFPPDYTLHHERPITPLLKRRFEDERPLESGLTASQHAGGVLFLTCLDTITTLRLFKSERLCCGPMWVFRRETARTKDTAIPWRCKLEIQCSVSGTLIDSLTSRDDSYKYVLNGAELPSLLCFHDSLGRLSLKFKNDPAIEKAVGRYASSNEVKADDEVIDLFICLESLMLEQDEGLSFRLAQRTANLLGHNSETRRSIYCQLRDYYGLRSKIVHGSKLSNKQLESLKNIKPLREIVRQVLIAVLGISAEIPLGPQFYAALDEMSLDEEKRKHLQALAATHRVRVKTVTQ